MKYWPVPNSYSKTISADGSQGSFWEERGDRHHCGIDIYAPEGINVLSIEDGKVREIGKFTSADKIQYWNTTYFIFVENENRLLCKYAELANVTVNINESISCRFSLKFTKNK